MLVSSFLIILSAVLLILSFPKAEFSFLPWIALVPWFLALRKQKPKNTFLLSYLMGLVFFSGTIYWLNYVTGLGFTILVCYLALYFAIFGLAFSTVIDTRRRTWRTGLIVACVWVSLEYVRAHLFTGFGWALLGYSQYSFLPIIQISDITGAYGVSFLIVLVNVCVFQLIEKCRMKNAKCKIVLPVFYAVLVISAMLGYGYFRLNQPVRGQKIKVAVVQGNIPQQMKWDPKARDEILEQYSFLTKVGNLDRPHLIIWPETSVPGYLENEPELLNEIASLSVDISPSYLLVGTPHLTKENELYNSASLLFSGDIKARYDKLHLVPFGEFLPFRKFFSRFSFAQLITDFSPGREYTVFSTDEHPLKIKFSVLICFEDTVSRLARKFRLGGADFLINMTNDAWFSASSEPYQHVQASVFRAVENRMNVVRSANTGVSCFIDPYGQITNRVKDDAGRDIFIEGIETKELEIGFGYSFYTKFGDIFAWCCLLMSIIGLCKLH